MNESRNTPEKVEAPRVDRRDAATLYLVLATGAAYRVHDCTFRGGRPYRVALGAAAATHRYFVSAQRERRVVLLGRGSNERALTAEHLARQLQVAGYLGTSKFDPTTHGAR